MIIVIKEVRSKRALTWESVSPHFTGDIDISNVSKTVFYLIEQL